MPLSVLESASVAFNAVQRCPPSRSEHAYNTEQSGYFSYLHTLDGAPRNNIEQIIHHVWRAAAAAFPAAAEARFAEWCAAALPARGAGRAREGIQLARRIRLSRIGTGVEGWRAAMANLLRPPCRPSQRAWGVVGGG